jgi:hypothetical protein
MLCAPLELPVPDTDWSASFFANEPNYLYDGVALQNGTIDSELLDLMPDESLRNYDLSSQKTTIPFDPRPWFMESDMDDGSHSAPNAKKLNALVSSY